MEQLIGFLQFSLAHTTQFGYTKSNTDKLVLASLAELLHKLSTVHTCFKRTYKLQIHLSHGLALVVHCRKPTVFNPGYDEILINDIIGRVAQKAS